jgi:hypothetical protein
MQLRRSLPGALAAVIVALTVGLFAGCLSRSTPETDGAVGPAAPGGSQLVRAFPMGCSDFGFSPKRCAAIVAIARQQLAIADPSATVELLSEAPLVCPTNENGQTVLCNRSGGHTAVIVRITPPGGPPEESTFFCGVGSERSIACTNQPVVNAGSPIDGYRDIPCASADAGGNPTGCATPLPSIEASATKAARPLKVAALDIPIGRDGAYAVKVGTAGIANGVLTTARFSIADVAPDLFFLDEGGVSMQIRPTDPTHRPFDNYYQHGWYPGVEDAEVFLVFNVISHDPGAALQIRDLSVR